MKRFRLIILSLMMMASITAAASSSISLSSVQGVPRDTVTVIVNLNTTDAVSAVDITIPLGSYLKYASNSVVLNSTRSNGHYVSASQVGNDLRLIIYSLSLSTLNGQSGELLRFDLALGKEPGLYTLTPQVVLSNSSGSTISSSSSSGSVTILASKIALSASQIDFGHIPIRSNYTQYVTLYNTGTSTLNISDITFNDSEMSCQLPSSIAAGGSQTVAVNYSPMTHGATTATMNIMSDASNGKQVVNISADPFSVNELHLLRAQGVSDDTVDVYLTMNNMEPIVGMQCSFKMPDGLDFIPNSFNVATRSVNHIATSTLSHDTLTLMAYSLNNTPFTGNDDTLGSFKVRLNGSSNWYHLNPENVALANAAGVNMVSATYGEYVVISAPRINVSSQLNMGDVSVVDTGRVGLRINNNSNVDLNITKVTFLAEGYNVASQLPMVIQGYGNDTLWVEYHPTAEGSFNTTMQIYSNDPASRMTSVNVYGVAFEPNEINLKGRCLSDGRYALTVGLDNYSDIVALQMDIHWLDSMNTNSSALTLKTRANGMLSMVSKMSEGTYRVALFSMNNTPLSGHSGDVLELVYDGSCNYNNTNIVVDNLIASTLGGVNKISVPVESLYVDIKRVTAACNSSRGTVTGGGLYNVGDTAVLVATALSDYHFVEWSNGETDETLHVVVNSDVSLTARFVHNPYLFEESHTICQNEVYSWHNRQLTTAGVYYDSLKTSENVDSVYKLTLTVNPTYLLSSTESICQGETYTWRNRVLSIAGVYYDSLTSQKGCDSVYQLTLTVNPTYFYEESHAICQGETYNWHNKSLTASGVYYDSLQTAVGCDSVYKLILTVNSKYFIQQNVKWPSNKGNYRWHGKSIPAAGVYYDSLLSVYGCDSVYKLDIQFADNYLFVENVSICQGEQYAWRNQQYSVSGVYYDSLRTIDNILDSVYKLVLTVNPTYFFEEAYSICQGETYNWHSKSLTSGGVYYDSLTTIAGCDSIYQLTLTVNPKYSIQEAHSICNGETYFWHNKSLIATGVYYDSLQTAAGCDSVYKLTLTVNPFYFLQEAYSICQGETYNWHNQVLSVAGVYYDSLTTMFGCDSVYELTLTVNPTYEVNNTAVLPNGGGGYQWHGKVYYEAGDYIDSLKTQYGCDSICNLHLSDSLHTSVDNPSALMEISLAPNPIKAGEVAYIYAEWLLDMDENVQVDIVDMSGRIIKKLQSDEFPIAIDGITIPGAYLIRIRTANSELYTRKLLVK